MRTIIWMAAGLLCGVAAMAQDSKDAAPKPVALRGETVNAIPLRLNILLTRQQGEKKVSSRPYSMLLHAPSSPADNRVELFVGAQVPFLAGGTEQPATLSFKNAGVSLRADAGILPDGRYRLAVKFDDSSVVAPDGATAGAVGPVIRVFTASTNLFLRDGESASFASAIDPLTGESVKADVTLNVLK
jgi:Flp pilus assembly secretin CpaC